MGELKDRIREAADEVGGLNRLADLAGIPRRTLGHYIDGSTEPKVSQLRAIAAVTATSIAWLATGIGSKINASEQNSVAVIETDVLKEIAKIVSRVHRDEGVKLSIEAGAIEAGRLYNDLLERAEDPNDRAELEALFPWLENRLRKSLREARDAPGTGKRSA